MCFWIYQASALDSRNRWPVFESASGTNHCWFVAVRSGYRSVFCIMSWNVQAFRMNRDTTLWWCRWLFSSGAKYVLFVPRTKDFSVRHKWYSSKWLILFYCCPGSPPMNTMAPSPAVPNLLDGGGPLNPSSAGQPALPQKNYEPLAPQNQDFSTGL